MTSWNLPNFMDAKPGNVLGRSVNELHLRRSDENVTGPRNFYEIKNVPDAEEWVKVYGSEIQSLETVGQLRVTENLLLPLFKFFLF